MQALEQRAKQDVGKFLQINPRQIVKKKPTKFSLTKIVLMMVREWMARWFTHP